MEIQVLTWNYGNVIFALGNKPVTILAFKHKKVNIALNGIMLKGVVFMTLDSGKM